MKALESPKSVLVWSIVVAALASITSILGLVDPTVYSRETRNWATQAKGQDIGNLLAAATLLISGFMYSRGSFRSSLVWLGTLFYFVYAFIVYGVAVHFNFLFLAYVAVLGLSSYALIFSLGHIRQARAEYLSGRKFAAYTLLGVGILFALLWLSEVFPAVVQGEAPQSTKDAGLWVNPIHVIDLSVVLPGFIITGYLLLKKRANGYFFAAPWLAFSTLMGASIVAAMALPISEGAPNAIPPLVMVAVVVGLSLLALIRYLRRVTVTT